ncbi:GNAT family N-acetyltransferase [Halorussus caseinilyticus]|uniref:GNAT family N-acetyltransferase n=1 Tax=Halorussus caseinilyticus TaxID=3034025 RepID=A0ABD5WHA0_9EURY|nr:GNAT family N-acetyltransferase [Halorussus sp. DT72]
MVSVELGSIEDADAAADRWVELAADQRGFGSHLLADENRATIREAIARSAVSDELLVARDDAGELVGFVTFGVESSNYEQDATRGFVQNIYVVPDRRDEGVGSELLGAAETKLVDDGADTLALEMMADNRDARRFYRRHGYAPHRVELEKSVESDTLTKE